MIFFDQFKEPTIKFGKCFAEFMIFVTIIEVTNMQKCSGKANKLRYKRDVEGHRHQGTEN